VTYNNQSFEIKLDNVQTNIQVNTLDDTQGDTQLVTSGPYFGPLDFCYIAQASLLRVGGGL